MHGHLIDLDEVRRSHDIMGMLDTHKRKPPYVCPLPGHIHSSNTPSFSVYWHNGVQRFNCFGNCNLSGDVIDFVGYMYVPGYSPKDKGKLFKAVEYLERNVPMRIPIPEKDTKLYGSEWYDYLPIQADTLQYAKSRGLSDKTIEKFRLGTHQNFMSIPSFEEGILKGVKFRNITRDGTRFMALSGSAQSLFNCDSVAYSHGKVFIVKGEIPAMLLDQYGYKACAPTGGEGGWHERWRVYLAFSKNIVVGDNDAPGRKLAPKRADLLKAELVYPPDPYKDLDQWALADFESFKAQMEKWNE
jgi:hypothetical protein